MAQISLTSRAGVGVPRSLISTIAYEDGASLAVKPRPVPWPLLVSCPRVPGRGWHPVYLGPPARPHRGAPARATFLAATTPDSKVLLAQLDADLQTREARLHTASLELDRSRHMLDAFTDTLRQAMMEAGPDATGLHPFVRVAQRYAGTPYVWGGESGRGFDCSGFIMVVMRDLGYRALPHSAAEQFTYGKPVAQALLKPGDIVFFKNTYKPGISHVGIYLGKRRFIHAAGTGIGTIVSSLDTPHFQQHYAGARRLIPARS